MTVNLLMVIASAVACAAVAWILWWAFGRVRSGSQKALIAVGTVLLGYVIYVAVQVVMEELYPVTRGANGHIIAYDLYIFTAALVVVVGLIFLSRKATTTAAS